MITNTQQNNPVRSDTSKKISIIIPAYDEEKILGKTLRRLREIRKKENLNLEIIVAVRKSKDRTWQIACELGDIVTRGGAPSQARNNGAQVATGEILVFLDADIIPNFGTLSKIAEATKKNVIGTCTAYPSRRGLMPYLAIGSHNLLRAAGLIKGLTGLLFVHRSLIHKQNICYDPGCNVGEHYDFIRRARKQGDSHFTYLHIPRGYQVSVDRYEEQGYLKTLWFWIKWALATQVLGQNHSRFEKIYWS